MAKQKYYVVWQGAETGIFSTWEECNQRVKGYKKARYKAFDTHAEAQQAFSMGFEAYRKAHPSARAAAKPTGPAASTHAAPPTISEAIAVDAACSGNPGAMEYRGVHQPSGQQVFHYGPVFGTNNIGEFLAIVHALALLKAKQLPTMPIYSDSRNAQLWVKAKKCKTKLELRARTAEIHHLIARAEHWLETNTYANPIIKWQTDEWGEIPADFGRK